jgi:lysophospholipid acyltransferase (LPLAT)-like uncharacterized protein
MKVRHPLLLKTLAYTGAWSMRLWMNTLDYCYHSFGPNVDPNQPDLKERYIYAFWHEHMLMPVFRYTRSNIHALISQHGDGQMLADVCRALRVRVIRGSTTRGGVGAVRQLLRANNKNHIAITPDGPRGPRQQVKAGLIYLASQTGLPIAPLGIGWQRCWRFRSWDRFALPTPWTLGACVTTEPIAVPPDINDDELENYRLRAQDSLLWATQCAQDWADNGGRGKPRRRHISLDGPNVADGQMAKVA